MRFDQCGNEIGQVFFVVIPVGAFDGFIEQSCQAQLVWRFFRQCVGQCTQLRFRKNMANRLGAGDLVIDGEIVVRRGGGAPGGQEAQRLAGNFKRILWRAHANLK